MRRMILIVLIGCIAFLYATEPAPMAASSQSFLINSKSASTMEIKFRLPEFEVSPVQIGGQTYQKIKMADAQYLAEEGMPELPTLTTSIAIPYRGGVQIQVLNSVDNIVNEFLPYPFQDSDNSVVKSLVVNNSFYNGNSKYPQLVLEHGEPQILRDFRIVTIQVNPFIWDAATGKLTVRKEIDFKLSFTNEKSINELPAAPTYVSSSFAKIYESMILNFDDYRTLMVANEPAKYLVVYGNNSDPNYLDRIDEFVFWKRQKGADVTAVSTLITGTSTSAITTYLTGQFTNPTTRPDYIILIGDTSGSYPIPAHIVSGGSGDYPYTHLVGGDGLGDCFIGRLSAENLSQLEILLTKTYAYEKTMNLASADWLNRMLLVGDNAPSGISTMYISKYIKEMALQVNPELTFTELYDGNPSPTAMNAAMNQGVGIWDYRGYLGMSGWSPSESLINGFKLPHAVIITCGTGNYSGSTSTSEAFVRLGTSAAPKGAVTAIGMATSSTHTTFNNCVTGGIFSGIYTHDMRTMGEALLNGKLYLHQIYGVSSPSNAVSFAHWPNLMGDPTMEVFVGIPGQFDINVQQTIPLGMSLLDIAVSSGGETVADACVTLSQGTSIMARGYTGSDGNIILVLPESMTATDAVITVSKHNFKPLQQTIVVENSGTLVPMLVTIDDDTAGASIGNSNAITNSGETIEVMFGLKNTGSTTISGITGYLTTTNPYVTMIDSLVTYPAINGGAISYNVSSAVFQVSPECPDGTLLRFHIILTDGNAVNYNISEFISVENGNMNFVSYNVIDAGNQTLDPGENAQLVITISNSGNQEITGLSGRLYTLNDLVSVTDNMGEFGTISIGGQASSATDNYSLHARDQVLPGMLIPMRLKLTNATGFLQFVDFTLTVGSVTSTDPLGPCEYGYVIYDMTDTGYAQAPVYDWVGIAPSEGGQGTALAISDSYVSGNEGDQVGALSSAVVNLPFPFQFYGRLYHQITVCSNGFIALGESANSEFRNYRLPGAMGPSPMIAAFWDDLATHTGSGIYTMFDRNNHAFVVQWENMKNGYNGSSEETFQVILYDQSVYPTSLGDGPIKIQYKVFNNVNAQSGSRHGSFSTIGIEDHTGTRGLEYTFNNQYPTAAAPLSSLKALYITNVPTYHEAAHIIIGETYLNDDSGNNVCEPGETINLGIQLSNIGNIVANNIVAVVSTTDEYVTILNNTSEFFPLEAAGIGVNRTPYAMHIASNCPSGRVVNFVLTITSGENVWTRNFSIRVDAATLEFESFMVNDFDGTYNGIVEASETVKVIVNVRNSSEVAARNLSATLSVQSQLVTIPNPTIIIPNVAPNSTYQMVYDVTFAEGITPSSYVGFTVNATAANGVPFTKAFWVPYQMNGIINDFENDNAGLIPETGWTWGTPTQVTPFSGTKVWCTGLTGSYPHLVEYHLYTPTLTLTQASELKFRHNYGFQNGFDGANVGISTNGGTTWTVLSPVGGYTNTTLPGLNGEAGYSGNSSGWQLATFNLSAYTGQSVILRWRFGSNDDVNGIGWFIDNVEISGVSTKTGFIHGEVYPTSGISPTLATVLTNKLYSTHPQATGMYRVYMRNGQYSANAYMSGHQSSMNNQIVITEAAPTYRADFTLIYLPQPLTLNFNVNNDTGLFNMNWTEPYDPVLPVVGYNVYKRFDSGAFERVAQPTSLSYSETLTVMGNYQYYVAVRYPNAEGASSDTLSFAYPYTGIDDSDLVPGLVTKLRANFPNPFNPTTTIRYDMAKSGAVSIKIFNIKGQLVKTLYSGVQAGGTHSITWDGKDNGKRDVSSGVYFLRMDTNGYASTRKMLLMK
ncbi:MAG: gingipain R [Candidatus Cloacimonetes bacterium HGW-Cloacimonetes-1]|nr:MAG: gingipain R [Candidatus Cloacimonetes bacterium HGW-Cloacimonetes-1]